MKTWIFSVLTALITCSAAQAALTFAWTTDQVGPSFNITPGGSQVVHLYLKQTGGTANSGISAEDGLLGVGFSISRSSGTGTITGFAPDNTTFSLSSVQNQTTTTASFKGVIPDSVPVGPIPDNNDLILLGSLTVQSFGPGDTAFVIGDYGAATQTGTVLGVDLGSMDSIIGQGSFTISVPEPVSLISVAGGFLLLWGRKYS
jgi:hypothetical protein